MAYTLFRFYIDILPIFMEGDNEMENMPTGASKAMPMNDHTLSLASNCI